MAIMEIRMNDLLLCEILTVLASIGIAVPLGVGLNIPPLLTGILCGGIQITLGLLTK